MPGPKKCPESKRNDPYWQSFTAFMPKDFKKRIDHVVHMSRLTQGGPQDQSELLTQALEKYLPSMERYLKARIKEMYGTS